MFFNSIKLLNQAAFFLISVIAFNLVQAEEVDSIEVNNAVVLNADLIASTKSVPLDQMINGWRSGYQYGGDYAFADASWRFGWQLELSPFASFKVAKGYRHYYYFSFSPATADFFFREENRLEHKDLYSLRLKVESFESQELAFGSELDVKSWLNWLELDLPEDIKQLKVGVNAKFYQPQHFQFANLNGQAKKLSNNEIQASATIDYSFDEDKLLEADEDLFGNQLAVDAGFGYSFDFALSGQWNNWQASLQAKDLINQFRWNDALFQNGCINILNAGNGVACTTSGSSSGKSGRHEYKTFIQPSWQLDVAETQLGLSAHYFNHQSYHRYGLAKSLQSSLGLWSVFLYHPTSLGFAWQQGLHKVSLAADEAKFENMRNISLTISTGIRW